MPVLKFEVSIRHTSSWPSAVVMMMHKINHYNYWGSLEHLVTQAIASWNMTELKEGSLVISLEYFGIVTLSPGFCQGVKTWSFVHTSHFVFLLLKCSVTADEFQIVSLLQPQHLLTCQSSAQIANEQPGGKEEPSNDKRNRLKKSLLEGLMR